MSETCKVTVIIPNYNGMKYLPACLAALEKQTVSCFETLVVDNASSDGSLPWLIGSGVRYLREKKNLGFAGGVNAGIRSVSTPYLILLNNDTEVFPDFVEQLLRTIEQSPRIFSVSAKMLRMNEKDVIDDAGDGLCLTGWAYQIGTGQPASRFTKERNVFSACGGAAIYRTEVFGEIGLFDEAHFAYLEDLDIGWRAKLAGYYNLYCPDARVCHCGSATSGSKYNDFKVRLAARNNIWLHYKNQPPLQLFCNFGFLAAGTAVKIVFFAAKGYLQAYLQGLYEGFAGLNRVKRVHFTKKHIFRCLAIEWEMIAGTVDYVYNYFYFR